MAALTWPFAGLPVPWATFLSIAFVVVVAMFCWTLILFVRGLRSASGPPVAPEDGADRLFWIFLVPALNEEVTIADSVRRLLSLRLRNRKVVVLEDGSDDRTAEILDAIDHPDLHVINRRAPDARQGKAAALNHGYRMLGRLHEGFDRDRVIVCVIDADGRLHEDAPRYGAAHLVDERVGGVQTLVQIYNRRSLLTWFQDLEFSVYGWLFQAGRNDWGTAGMGGNGQLNRLSALDDVADEEGPWRHTLTEDQDLGLRLIGAGWEGRQDLRARVEQQGLSSLRPLLRQRTRWSQGNLQAISLLGKVLRAPFPLPARIEQLAYLLMPLWQTIVGLGLISAVYLLATGRAPVWGGGPAWQLAFFYLLCFGGTVMGCIAARTDRGLPGWLTGFLLGHVYALYTWLIWPVLIRSTLRQITSRRQWAKTERESLEDPAPAAG